jgi:hypothetical protein
MNEARAVLGQLRSLEALAADGARPESVLAEIRALVLLLERWLVAEPAAQSSVLPALERCRRALDAVRDAEVVAV